MKRKYKGSYKRLAETGLCVMRYEPGRDVLTINARHPAASEICAVLTEMSGVSVIIAPANADAGVVHPTMPLGHVSPVDFRVLVIIAHAGERLDEQTIRRRIPDHWPSSVTSAIGRLVKNRVLDLGVGGFAFAPGVAQSLSALVRRLADVIGDERLKPSDAVGPRAFAFNQAADGAPRLFGTDARLRNLMVLAVNGPMLYADLRKITGAFHLHGEGRDNAPFGRGGQVRIWETPDGTAVELDGAYPLALPLRRLLVRLAEVYPLPAMPPIKRPDPPPPQAWAGDRLALFGSAFPTKILMTLAGRGWTFEAVCCESHSKEDGADNRRVLTKKVIRRLEAEGVLVGSRPRGPGFGPRLLRIADAFPARDELQALIDAIPAAWPDLGDRIETAFAAIPEKTKVYFRKRGLWQSSS